MVRIWDPYQIFLVLQMISASNCIDSNVSHKIRDCFELLFCRLQTQPFGVHIWKRTHTLLQQFGFKVGQQSWTPSHQWAQKWTSRFTVVRFGNEFQRLGKTGCALDHNVFRLSRRSIPDTKLVSLLKSFWKSKQQNVNPFIIMNESLTNEKSMHPVWWCPMSIRFRLCSFYWLNTFRYPLLDLIEIYVTIMQVLEGPLCCGSWY